MSIRVECGHCFATMEVAEKYAGKAGKCKTCGGRVKVPQPGAAPPNTSFDAWFDSALPPPRTAPRQSSKRTSSDADTGALWKRLLAVLGSILIFMVARTAFRMAARLARVGADKVADAVAPEEPGSATNNAGAAAIVPALPSLGKSRGQFPEYQNRFADAEVTHTEPPMGPSPPSAGVVPQAVAPRIRSRSEIEDEADATAPAAPAIAATETPTTPAQPPKQPDARVRSRDKIPPGTRELRPDEELEVGMRVIADWGAGWEAGRVMALIGDDRVFIDFLRLGDGFDDDVEYDKIRIQLPKEEIDPELMITARHEVFRSARINAEALKSLEVELLKLEGYIPDSVKVDRRTRQASFVVIRDSFAQRFPNGAFHEAGIPLGRKLSP